jgi:stalled ribosome alternative rescue factor ArfA
MVAKNGRGSLSRKEATGMAKSFVAYHKDLRHRSTLLSAADRIA